MLALLFITAYPSTNEELWKNLNEIVLKRITHEIGMTSKGIIALEKFRSVDVDIAPLKTILAIGTYEAKNESSFYRSVAIFESGKQNTLDRFVGRPAGYKIRSFSYLNVETPEALRPQSVEALDLDEDRITEFHIKLESTWADSASVGPLIFKRNNIGEEWKVFGLQSISELTTKFVNGENITDIDSKKVGSPHEFFGLKSTPQDAAPPSSEIVLGGIYEDKWELNTDGKKWNLLLCEPAEITKSESIQERNILLYLQLRSSMIKMQQWLIITPLYISSSFPILD